MKFNKVYYTQLFFDEILPRIAQISNQSRYGYHGLTHTTQVALFGIDIAQNIEQDALPVMLAAGLHDCARTNDKWCTEHGPKAVPIARKFLQRYYAALPHATVQQILYAVENHTVGKTAPDGVSACLWDADRIRLSWEFGFEPNFFNTERGREIAGLNLADQQRYISNQDTFLVWHKIRTQAQIDFDRQQDILQNAVGTEFKIR